MKLIAIQAINTWATGRFGLKMALWVALGAVTASVAQQPEANRLRVFSGSPEGVAPAPWRVVSLPDKKIPATEFAVRLLDEKNVLQVRANRSYGTLSHALPLRVPGPQTTLQWRWRVDQALTSPNLRSKQGDDAAIKVCAMFDMPLERLGFVERNLMRLARSRSGETLPAATLCYVWDITLNTGTLLPNPYTPRVRYLVLNGSGAQSGQWASHSRNLQQDFKQAFGDESPSVPPLMAIVVGADGDNTGGESLAYVGDLTLVEQSAP